LLNYLWFGKLQPLTGFNDRKSRWGKRFRGFLPHRCGGDNFLLFLTAAAALLTLTVIGVFDPCGIS
jgi:hypothetical protein